MDSYDLSISFAGENRELAEELAINLQSNGFRIFYDDFEKAELWGRDLSVELPKRYQSSKFCIMLISQEYLNKMWTTLERQVVISKFLELKGNDYLLPIRLNGFKGEVPGLTKMINYVDYHTRDNIDDLISLLLEVLKNRL